MQAPGGRYANGLITRNYLPGSDMVVKVDVTANHKGFFTFRLCANNNTDQDPRQQCFDQTILKVIDISACVLPSFRIPLVKEIVNLGLPSKKETYILSGLVR